MRALAAFLAALSLDCAAAPFAVRLGGDRLVLDSPPGFSDTMNLASPRLNELAESLTDASNRILMFAIPDADLRNFMNGERMELRRYMVAVTPGRVERERVDPQLFAVLVADSLRGLGQPAGTADFAKHLDAQPPGRASLLAELRKEPEVVSILQGTRLPPQGRFMEKPRYLLSTATLLLVRGKALNLSVYTRYDDPADLEWIGFTTRRWVDELLRLNER
jgi:hypothetical protein